MTDRKGARRALGHCKPGLKQVPSLVCDSGYTGEPFAQGVREILGKQVTVQIAKRSELHTFKIVPKRWIVERSFAWLEKNRQLEEPRTQAQYQPATDPSGLLGLLGILAQKTLNRF